MSQAVRRSLDAFAQEFRRRRVEVRVALPDRLPAVTGDERLLAQAFASVMSNSLEALPDGGRIEVSGALSDDRRPAPPFGTRPIQFVDVFPNTPDRKIDLCSGHLDAESAVGLYAYIADPATDRFPLALISP